MWRIDKNCEDPRKKWNKRKKKCTCITELGLKKVGNKDPKETLKNICKKDLKKDKVGNKS